MAKMQSKMVIEATRNSKVLEDCFTFRKRYSVLRNYSAAATSLACRQTEDHEIKFKQQPND